MILKNIKIFSMEYVLVYIAKLVKKYSLQGDLIAYGGGNLSM